MVASPFLELLGDGLASVVFVGAAAPVAVVVAVVVVVVVAVVVVVMFWSSDTVMLQNFVSSAHNTCTNK